MHLPMPSGPLESFVQWSQCTAGQWVSAELPLVLSSTWGLLERIPVCAEDDERRVVALVVTMVACRLFSQRPVLAAGIAAASHNGPGPVQCTRVCSLITSRYRDPHIDLTSVAGSLNISTSHLSHFLRRCTGYGLPAHVNGLRVLDAVRLLQSTRQSVKEVSAYVGYRRTSELDRQFHRWCRMRPLEMRSLIARSRAVP
jgi:AraC-like DNA-binding protein